MKPLRLTQLPILGVWWLRRKLRYAYWGSYNRLCGPLKFEAVGTGVKFNGRVRVEHPFSRIRVGNHCMIGVGCYFVAQPPQATVTIGNHVSLNDNCYVTSCYGITIGDNVRIAEHVSIRDYDHEFADTSVPIRTQGMKGAPITIGDDVWIGRGVMITAGVTIGRGSIIGANAVVTKDVPPWSIAVGIPARVIRSRRPAADSAPPIALT